MEAMLGPGSSAKVAVVQASPLYFDREGSVEKVARMTQEAGREGARARGVSRSVSWGAIRGVWPSARQWGAGARPADAPGSAIGPRPWRCLGPRRIGWARPLAEAGVFLAVGVIERDSTFSGGTLFCTLLYFGPDGALLGKHRKLKPTAAERLIWGEGDGSTLPVIPTPSAGSVGSSAGRTTCPWPAWPCTGKGWRSTWPPRPMPASAGNPPSSTSPWRDGASCWDATSSSPGTCTRRTLRSRRSSRTGPRPYAGAGAPSILRRRTLLAGPLWDREGILYAELDMGEVARGKFDFDVTGHYARPDVFQLYVNQEFQPAVDFGE
jgi:nitrilase